MDREHLSESEINSLLDEETGGGAGSGDAVPGQVRNHATHCERCRTLLAASRSAVAALETLPRRSPSPHFADRVMSQVTVFRPVHVTLSDMIERVIPRSPALRVAFGSVFALSGLLLSAVVIWSATRLEELAFAATLGVERGRVAALGAAEQAVMALMGEPTAAMLDLRSAGGIWFTLSVLGASALISAVGLRVIASVARRGGS